MDNRLIFFYGIIQEDLIETMLLNKLYKDGDKFSWTHQFELNIAGPAVTNMTHIFENTFSVLVIQLCHPENVLSEGTICHNSWINRGKRNIHDYDKLNLQTRAILYIHKHWYYTTQVLCKRETKTYFLTIRNPLCSFASFRGFGYYCLEFVCWNTLCILRGSL